MNLHRMIAELEEERERLDQAILALERLSTSTSKGRGRIPHLSKDAEEQSPDTAEPPSDSKQSQNRPSTIG